jgi:predicted Zn-dependent protease
MSPPAFSGRNLFTAGDPAPPAATFGLVTPEPHITVHAKPLEPPDSLHVLAAQGWLELGSAAEAKAELEHISSPSRAHPHVLELRWQILVADRHWEAALQIAAALLELDPEDPLGWVHQSYCLHELKRTIEARDNLLRIVHKFPASATMRYNLACYECQLGNLVQTKIWLEAALRLGDRHTMKATALEDLDLKPIWDYIRSK